MNRKDANIALYGFMGSGKSTIGRLLASSLSRAFIDLDQCIELESGSAISDIFAQNGEDYFRHLEAEMIATFPVKEPHVLALGGGALLEEKNKEHICSLYRVYTLIVPYSILQYRLNDQTRPLAPYAESLYQTRLSHYKNIGTKLTLMEESPSACVDLILEDLYAA